MENSTGPEKRYDTLTAAERSFVDEVAHHYHTAHGVTWEKGRVMAWMIISDPPEQTLEQICAAVDATPEAIEQLIEQLTLAGLYQRVEEPGREPRYRLVDDGYPKAVSDTFASWPEYHRIFQFGLEALADAGAERRKRVAEIEELFGHIVGDLADMSRRWEEHRRTVSA
ncbi:hypothetical protein GCM10023347_25110 [Streptomyces chumphonensis]|uniref:MarR family transcriptional regulator n=1 Tax=Streptomyces chumphonensis TaxID=1214925 RepID=A0A927EW39_9ACTN|nr:hypothetical protein [Streptomyces chumphonensis]MBD3929997.1 hypothetical protein [Streptomyces chumphonensis]